VELAVLGPVQLAVLVVLGPLEPAAPLVAAAQGPVWARALEPVTVEPVEPGPAVRAAQA